MHVPSKHAVNSILYIDLELNTHNSLNQFQKKCGLLKFLVSNILQLIHYQYFTIFIQICFLTMRLRLAKKRALTNWLKFPKIVLSDSSLTNVKAIYVPIHAAFSRFLEGQG